ncbi:FAD-dependent monooxygenase [Roseomonas sp. BN140053]|uniref:FAD-dependent monooxygenase n=1 Tax=Roseomonas sp. BN140053 TaxID=3391898 RepID=UPI0039E9716A
MEEPILVAGGGLGGLFTALALGRRGIAVRVLEQAPAFEAIGYGIQLGPNVFPHLERLGLREAVLGAAHLPPAVLMLDALSGEEVARIPTGASFQRRFRHPYVVIHRVDLYEILLAACRDTPGITLEPSTAVAGFEAGDDGVRVRTAEGREIRGAALIGADGLRSAVRAQLRAEGEPDAVGYVAHRTLVPMEQVPAHVRRDEVILWGGPGFHIVHYPLRANSVFNIVAVFRTETHAQRRDPAAYKAELQHTYRDAHPAMKTLLSLMSLERRWPISDRAPIRHWSHGRVTLLGDAAHPTLQSLAQGACMAIEDGSFLAELVGQAAGDHAAAFRRYAAERYVRTSRVQLESRALWDVYHCDGIARDVRRQTFGERSEEDYFRCLAWLYDGADPPAALRSAAA